MNAGPVETGGRDWSIVLIQPARGGNIGAAARAMKTMGFTDLRVVDPSGTAPLDDPEAAAFAHGSTEILAAATRWDSLADALADCDTVVGTTGRRRGNRSELYTPEDLIPLLTDGPAARRVAVVFGPEERGLSNDELDQCDIVSAIPMRAAYPSLNLGQAVMVYTYALSPLLFATRKKEEGLPADGSVRSIREKTKRVLPHLGFDPGRAITTRILERVVLVSETDTKLIHSLLNALEKRIIP